MKATQSALKIKLLRRAKKTLLPATVICAIGTILFASLLFEADPKIKFAQNDIIPIRHRIFRDRYGRMLRFCLNAYDERNIWMPESEIPGMLKNAFIATEDANFYNHSGYDPKAIIRAFSANLLAGQIVSGASTISQQLIRLLYPAKRTYANKLIEIIQSRHMEHVLTKPEILEQYLNRVPMGNQLRGVQAAALRYFGKSCRQLSIAECALLASLPKAPSRFNPYGNNLQRLLTRKNWVLKRMYELNFIDKKQLEKAKQCEIFFNKKPFPNSARHFVDALYLQENIIEADITTTIDLDIQTAVEDLLQAHRYRLSYRGAKQASVIVLHNQSSNILAMAGSIEYSAKEQGFNNGATAKRSAGSTLKPFLYGLALKRNYTPASIIPDTNRQYTSPSGSYTPKNYDRKEYGPVSIRTALGNSLNIPAVKMLNILGLKSFYRLLKACRLTCDDSKTENYYGLGLAVGNMEVSLLQLVSAYSMLANMGIYKEAQFIKNKKILSGKRVFEPEIAYLITDILSDATAITLTFSNHSSVIFPHKIAMKTGTSTYYRDGWAIGYTPTYTVGVWVGNFDGSPTYNLSGSDGAGPVLKEIINFLYKNSYPVEFQKPQSLIKHKVCGFSGMKPSAWCKHVKEEMFIAGTEPVQNCTQHNQNQKYRHISPVYAQWLYEKKIKGATGNFRLADYDDNLDKVFQDPWQIKDTIQMPLPEKNEEKKFSLGANIATNKTALPGKLSLPQIIYPLPEDRFVTGKHKKDNYIKMQAISEEFVEYLTWIIDGVEYTKTSPPFTTYWLSTKGRHSVSVITPQNLGSTISFYVE